MSQKALDALTKKFGEAILETQNKHGDDIAVVDPAKLVEIATFLRDDEDLAFNMPVFCTVIDKLYQDQEGPRFELVYQVRSIKTRSRVFLKVLLDDDKPKAPSLSAVWPGFNWLERETYDMYGVEFEGHPDLRRIYMYDEFVGYPLRKDYPKEKRQPLVRRDDLVN